MTLILNTHSIIEKHKVIMIIGSERVEWDRLTSGPLPKNPPTQNGNIVSYLSIANLTKINTASFGAILAF